MADQKTRFDLMCPYVEEEMAKAFTLGNSNGYDDLTQEDWENMAKALRHLNQYRKGEQRCGKDHQHHLAAVIVNLSVLLAKVLKREREEPTIEEAISFEPLTQVQIHAFADKIEGRSVKPLTQEQIQAKLKNDIDEFPYKVPVNNDDKADCCG